MIRIPTSSPPLVTTWGLALSDSEKAEALADSLEAHCQPVKDPSVPAVIEVVNKAMRACSFAPANEPKISNFTEVHDAIRVVKVGKAPGPNGVPNRALKHLPLSVVPSSSCYSTLHFDSSTSRQLGNTPACFPS